MIDPTDEALFISVMGKMGFREGKYDMYSEAFSPSTRSDVLKGKMFYHQIPPFCKKISPYYSYANAVFLDVNFSPFFGGQIKDPIEISEFMKNVCRTPYYNENFTYLSLRDEYDLLQNCFHFYKDMLYAPRKTMRDIYKIISFLDIREFIRNHRATLNWDKFSQLVSSNGLNESVYIVLYILFCRLIPFRKAYVKRFCSNNCAACLAIDMYFSYLSELAVKTSSIFLL